MYNKIQFLIIYNDLYYQVVPRRGFMEKTVPHRVRKTARSVTVTSLRELVWVVSLDTEVLSVIQVRRYQSYI